MLDAPPADGRHPDWVTAARARHRELSERLNSPDPSVRAAAFEAMSALVADAIARVQAAGDAAADGDIVQSPE